MKKNRSKAKYNGVNVVCGPATGIPTPEPHNEVLSKGKEHEYTGDSTPGTTNGLHPDHVAGGPGHKECKHE